MISTFESECMAMFLGVSKIIRSFVGPNIVILGTFCAQAIWVGPVSLPITRSQCETKEISSSKVIFGVIEAFVA